MYDLIITVVLWGYMMSGVGGGIEVEITRYQTLDQCEKVRDVVLEAMDYDSKAINSYRNKGDNPKIITKAICVSIADSNDDTQWPKSEPTDPTKEYR
jgi:hypothetical protein